MAFNPDVFRWARETAGLDLQAAAHAIGVVPASLTAIETGEKIPSRAKLAQMAKAYRRSLLSLYLPAPPPKGDRGEDFRTVVAERSILAEADVDALVRDLRARQSLVRAVLEEDEDAKPLEFVGSATIDVGVQRLTKSLEELLGVTRAQYRAAKDAEDGFTLLRERAERAGVFVILAGNLGSHHSTVPVEAFRGLAISDRIAPFVVINDGDAKAAWSFTLLHELAHLWLGASGVSGGTPELRIERFCNDVAAEFLVTREDLQSIRLQGLGLEAQIAEITLHARQWRVSRQMVAYGLHKVGLLSIEEWKALEGSIRALRAAESRREKERRVGASGPSYYVVRRHRLGRAMLDFARRYTDAGSLSPSKAAKVLGVKARAVHPLLATV